MTWLPYLLFWWVMSGPACPGVAAVGAIETQYEAYTHLYTAYISRTCTQTGWRYQAGVYLTPQP